MPKRIITIVIELEGEQADETCTPTLRYLFRIFYYMLRNTHILPSVFFDKTGKKIGTITETYSENGIKLY